jgi:hypothetical protein
MNESAASSSPKTLDKELYRYVYDLHRQWNEAELRERIRTAGQRPPEEGWRHYVALWEFAMKLASQSSPRLQEQRLAEWEQYYARIQQFEEWRRKVGKTT